MRRHNCFYTVVSFLPEVTGSVATTVNKTLIIDTLLDKCILHSLLAAPVAEWVRSLNFSALYHLTGVGSSPALATCETSQVLLTGVSGEFSRGTHVSTHIPIGSSRYE